MALLFGFTSTAPAQRGAKAQAIGRSRGGLTTKIVAVVDALGNLARFVLLPGQRHDSVGVDPLLKDLEFAALLADKAFDSDVIRADLNDQGAVAVIPPKADRAVGIPCDFESTSGDIWSRTSSARSRNSAASPRAMTAREGTRSGKTDESFKAMIHLVGIVLATR